MFVGGGVVRRVGRSVPEEVDADDAATRVAEQIDPARGAPPVLEGRRESVHEDDRFGAHANQNLGGIVNSRQDNGASPSCWRTNSSRNQIQNARTSSGVSRVSRSPFLQYSS